MAELGPNLFQFFIPDVESRLRILDGGPWLIDSQILVLHRWEARIEENFEAFKFAPLWVQVWNLPIHWISKDVGRKIWKVFKEVKEVLIPHSGGKDGKHLKLLVNADLTQPLLRGTAVKMDGVLNWISFRYERVPDFCYKCGIIGHSEKKCKNVVNIKKGQQENQYGPWLRAQMGKDPPIRKEAYPVRNESVKDLGLTRSIDMLQGQKELPTEKTQNLGQENEEILDAQEVDWSTKMEEWKDEDKQPTGTEESELEIELIAVENPPAQGLMGNMKLENRMENGIIMSIDMQVDEDDPDQLKGSGVSRKRNVRLLNKKNERVRQPLIEIQNLEPRKGINTKRKLQIMDEEMLDMESTEQAAKRNKSEGKVECNVQFLKVKGTNPSWSLNQP
ncbi:uncharacterized protein LOC113771491 [Coffea eugenioides]|uniref:uncharacterized protein LOC113771491 n=1 Tax=Coffea eugenioides TaxID=49369 RepID=UPI000F60A607|nr:uncharacterized protein LOC113771491 [Coffea eugenioides]